MVRANLPLARVRSGRVLRSRDAACEKLKATTADLQCETGIDPAAPSADGASLTIAPQRQARGPVNSLLRYVMLPGMKHLITMFWPSNLTGQTIVLPNRFGSVITASSGTSIHAPSRRTR